MSRSLGRLIELLGSLAGLGGLSSSSLLRVRSTSWPADLLLLDVSAGSAAIEEVEFSLDEVGGDLIKSGSRVPSLFIEASREAFLISTSSSSPSLLLRQLQVLGGERIFPEVWDHFPFGSIMT